jgi:ethanolamine utilization protein EutP (predicted NTPase)
MLLHAIQKLSLNVDTSIKVISFVGNVASGKTTIMEELTKLINEIGFTRKLQCITFYEPLSDLMPLLLELTKLYHNDIECIIDTKVAITEVLKKIANVLKKHYRTIYNRIRTIKRIGIEKNQKLVIFVERNLMDSITSFPAVTGMETSTWNELFGDLSTEFHYDFDHYVLCEKDPKLCLNDHRGRMRADVDAWNLEDLKRLGALFRMTYSLNRNDVTMLNCNLTETVGCQIDFLYTKVLGLFDEED